MGERTAISNSKGFMMRTFISMSPVWLNLDAIFVKDV
jgi:hypothetical protein